jgi:hypothetical protein
MLERRKESVLHRIIRVGLLGQHSECHGVRRTNVAFDERFECPGLAAPCPGDEIGVGRFLRFDRWCARLHSFINA